MIRNIRSPSFQLKIQIDLNRKLIDAHALLDSGAKGIYCNTSFIEKHLIPTHAIDRPVYPFNVDGTINKNGAMRHAAILRMGMHIDQDHWETAKAAITNLGQTEIIGSFKVPLFTPLLISLLISLFFNGVNNRVFQSCHYSDHYLFH